MKRTKIVGRKLGNMHYIHKSSIAYLPTNEKTTLQNALTLINTTLLWNLVKISTKGDQVSFLYYKDFDNELFPTLTKAVVVKIIEGEVKTIDYTKRKNPPVLHRKELFLPPEDPRIEHWARITRFCEEKGLFDNASHIGTIEKWKERLLANNYKVNGQNIEKI